MKKLYFVAWALVKDDHQSTELTRGASQCGLTIYIRKYLNAKEELWKLKIFRHTKIIILWLSIDIHVFVHPLSLSLVHFFSSFHGSFPFIFNSNYDEYYWALLFVAHSWGSLNIKEVRFHWACSCPLWTFASIKGSPFQTHTQNFWNDLWKHQPGSSKTILGRWMGQSSKPFPDFLENSGNHQWKVNYYHVHTMGTILVNLRDPLKNTTSLKFIEHPISIFLCGISHKWRKIKMDYNFMYFLFWEKLLPISF